jgi:hypothetical protein
MKKLYLLIAALLLLMIPLSVDAKTIQIIDIHVFYSEDCPHCKAQFDFLERFTADREDVIVHSYEVKRSIENLQILNRVHEVMDNHSSLIPFTVIGAMELVGFNSNTELQIEKIVAAYLEHDYKNIVGEIINGNLTAEEFELIKDKYTVEIPDDEVRIPIFGNINPRTFSMPLISVVIGYIDGFNPCSIWVLLFIITLLIGMNDRKKMWILGGTFIFGSVLIYLFFMFVMLNLAVSMMALTFIRALIGGFAVGFGLWNLRKFNIARKQDSGCQVMNEKRRKKLMEKVKNITSEKRLFIAMGGVLVLAFSVNLIGFACTAGLPLLFTQILALNNITGMEAAMYIGLYMLAFSVNELIIFGVAMVTFTVTGISNKFTKYSYLIGGLIMLIIGLLLIFKPSWIMFNF